MKLSLLNLYRYVFRLSQLLIEASLQYKEYKLLPYILSCTVNTHNYICIRTVKSVIVSLFPGCIALKLSWKHNFDALFSYQMAAHSPFSRAMDGEWIFGRGKLPKAQEHPQQNLSNVYPIHYLVSAYVKKYVIRSSCELPVIYYY